MLSGIGGGVNGLEKGVTVGQGILVEIIGTMMLVLPVLFATDSKRTECFPSLPVSLTGTAFSLDLCALSLRYNSDYKPTNLL